MTAANVCHSRFKASTASGCHKDHKQTSFASVVSMLRRRPQACKTDDKLPAECQEASPYRRLTASRSSSNPHEPGTAIPMSDCMWCTGFPLGSRYVAVKTPSCELMPGVPAKLPSATTSRMRKYAKPGTAPGEKKTCSASDAHG